MLQASVKREKKERIRSKQMARSPPVMTIRSFLCVELGRAKENNTRATAS